MNNIIYLDGSVKVIEDGVEMSAVDMWLDEKTSCIAVRWVDKDGADATSELTLESDEFIWEIINSIKK